MKLKEKEKRPNSLETVNKQKPVKCQILNQCNTERKLCIEIVNVQIEKFKIQSKI